MPYAGLNQVSPKHIGMTSLRLQSHGAFAMLICDNELWRVSTSADGVPNDCFLSRIWITEQSNVSLENPLHQAALQHC
jgi:hypothetical protein